MSSAPIMPPPAGRVQLRAAEGSSHYDGRTMAAALIDLAIRLIQIGDLGTEAYLSVDIQIASGTAGAADDAHRAMTVEILAAAVGIAAPTYRARNHYTARSDDSDEQQSHLEIGVFGAMPNRAPADGTCDTELADSVVTA